jgi:uncharacterized membrane protein
MSWIVFALSGPVLYAISTHLDKYLVEKYFKHSSVAVLLVFTAFAGLAVLPFIWLFDHAVFGLDPRSMILMALSGALYLGAMYFYLQALQAEEASVVAPFFQAGPLFGYVLGYAVLGETLTGLQILGAALVIGGTLAVSLRPGGGKNRFKWNIAGRMVLCAAALAVSSLIFKIFALREDFWPTTFWMFAGQAAFGLGLLSIRRYRQEFASLSRTHLGPLVTINAANELINIGGSLGARYALTLAPLSLVQTVGSTTSLFVFAIGIFLTVFFPSLGRESLAPRELLRKGGAAVLVGAGIVLITR